MNDNSFHETGIIKHNPRTLVVDIDQTICFPIDRDYENAGIDNKLVEKLNSLYDSGWNIIEMIKKEFFEYG